jgi:hypothetical protein
MLVVWKLYSVDDKMIMNAEQLVELELAGKPKQSEIAGPQSNIVHHKSNISCSGIKSGLPRWEAGRISK